MPDANLAVGDVLEVRFEGTISGERWNNVIHVAITTAPSNPDDIYDNLKALADALNTAWSNAISPLSSDLWILFQTRVKRIRPTASVFAFHAEALVGAVTGIIDEPDDAVVVRLYTSQAGRSHQGRVYIAGIPDVAVEDGYASVSYAADLAENLQEFFVGPITGPNGMVVHTYVWSRKLSDDGDPLTQAAWPVTHIFVDRVIRRMTRRDRKHPLLVEGS